MEKSYFSDPNQISKYNRSQLVSTILEKDAALNTLLGYLKFEKNKQEALACLSKTPDKKRFIQKILDGMPISKNGFVRCVHDAKDYFGEKIIISCGDDSEEYEYLDGQINRQLGGKNILLNPNVAKTHHFTFAAGKKYPHSILALPIIRKSEKIGFIWFGDQSVNAFSKEQIDLITKCVEEYQLVMQLFMEYYRQDQAISTYHQHFESIEQPIIIRNKEKRNCYANSVARDLLKFEEDEDGFLISKNGNFNLDELDDGISSFRTENATYLANRVAIVENDENYGEIIRFVNVTKKERIGNYQKTIIEALNKYVESEVEKISGFVSLTRSLGKLSQKQGEYLQSIEREIQSMNEIISDLVLINRLDKNGFIEIEEVEINKVLSEVIEKFKPIITQKHIYLDLDGISDKKIKVLSDENLIKHIFLNLFESSMHDAPLGSDVRIDCKKEKDYLEFTINDKGRGISKPDIEALFSGEDIETSFSNLKVVNAITKILLGEMAIKSEIGKGKLIIVKLPISND